MSLTDTSKILNCKKILKSDRIHLPMKKISILKTEKHKKGWGEEEWITNNEMYCGKLLKFNNGSMFSDHFHIVKDETWYVLEGKLELYHYNLSNGDKLTNIIKKGDVVHIPSNVPHQLKALETSAIIEISTPHREDDSYRINKGDSQKNKKIK